MSKKAKKAAAAAREAAAAVPPPPPPPPPAPPKPLGKKALLIAAKKAGAKKSSRLSVTREKAADRAEASVVPTVPLADERPRSFFGRRMTAQIAPKYKPAIGRDPGALVG